LTDVEAARYTEDMSNPRIVLPLVLLGALAFAAGCDEAGVSPEDVCVHGDKLAREEAAAAAHGKTAEAERLAREAAHSDCVTGQGEVKKRVGDPKWNKYSRCMVGKKTRAEQQACEEHTR
jgi:hypothetical protein